MEILERARFSLLYDLQKAGYDLQQKLAIRPLNPDEAIGPTASPELAIKRGPEKVIQAEVNGVIGQAFTEQPASWSGTVHQALQLHLTSVQNRAFVVAAINALMKATNRCTGSAHCRDGDPEACGTCLVKEIEQRFPQPIVGMFGFQPFLVKALVDRFGSKSVLVADLNPNNIGQIKAGVRIMDGEKDAERLAADCTFGLCTGSSIVNGTFDELWQLFSRHRKPVLFFGN
ncbi:MAG TPA: DUF364 domain-containing protein, partial [Candidatus Ozemobacteraceae bacterium]|nr:DUF364 domain-containing protein [Candidatus Ozemobacteraceae bacterium]